MMCSSGLMIRWSARVVLGASVLFPTGCGSRHNAAVTSIQSTAVTRPAPSPARQANPPATTQATAPTKTYENSQFGIRICYPASWQPEKSRTAVLAVAAPAGTAAGYSSLSLDIPKMPWHIKNVIPMAVVAHDYVADLQKDQIPDASVQEEVSITVPDANARRITSVGHENGKPSIDVAVILIHADQVYILSADSDDIGRSVARQAIDSAVASLKWTK